MMNENDKTNPRPPDDPPLNVDDSRNAPTPPLAVDRNSNTVVGWQAGQIISGKYELLKRIGRGGMGEVWKARDRVGDIDVALKLLPPELGSAPYAVARVKENFRLVHSLVHEHIAALLGLEKHASELVLVLEYIDGRELRTYFRDYLAAHPASGQVESLRIGAQIAAALDFAHARKIMHRDIKPENILIDASGSVKLLDFGLAAEIHQSLSQTGERSYDTSGTRPYMAPEQWKGQSQDAATDQYSLAVVLYELLAGRLPFENSDAFVLRECVLREAPESIPALNAASNSALAKGLAKARNERFSNCHALIEALRATSKTPAIVPLAASISVKTGPQRMPTANAGIGPNARPLGPRKDISAPTGRASIAADGAPVYMYEAMDPHGKEVRSEIHANSEEEAIEKIRAQKFFPTSVKLKGLRANGGELNGRVATPFKSTKRGFLTLMIVLVSLALAAWHFVSGSRTDLTAVNEVHVAVSPAKKNPVVPDGAGPAHVLKEIEISAHAMKQAQAEREGQFAKDVADANRVIEAAPKDARGRALLSAPLRERVENFFDAAEKINPGSDRVRVLKAKLAYSLWDGSEKISEYAKKNALAEMLPLDLDGVPLELALIPAGSFTMGSPAAELGRQDDEAAHRVTITQPFFMSKTEITQAQFKQVTGSNPSAIEDSTHPVGRISWNAADGFCRQLALRIDRKVRLPTEAEWEYACRAGAQSSYAFGPSLSGSMANFNSELAEFRNATTPVGTYKPNFFQLNDMHGNVWEWCKDFYDPLYYKASPPCDPQGPADGNRNVLRGGAFDSQPEHCRSACRKADKSSNLNTKYGFRIVVELP